MYASQQARILKALRLRGAPCRIEQRLWPVQVCSVLPRSTGWFALLACLPCAQMKREPRLPVVMCAVVQTDLMLIMPVAYTCGLGINAKSMAGLRCYVYSPDTRPCLNPHWPTLFSLACLGLACRPALTCTCANTTASQVTLQLLLDLSSFRFHFLDSCGFFRKRFVVMLGMEGLLRSYKSE